MEAPLKKSKQRDAILACVRHHHDHPTADMIYRELRESIPNISLGTVYRNLALLSNLGTIKKITGENHTDHFDAITTPHSHFLCKECGSVMDIDFQPDDDMIISASQKFKGTITDRQIIFFGICEDCMKNKKEESF